MNKFFDEIVIVNLERCPDRLEMITTQLNKFNLPYKVFPAFDGQRIINPSMKMLTRAPLKAFKKLNPKRLKYLPGMMSCAMSHISVIKHAQMMGLKGVLIFEDDAVLSPDFPDRLKLLEEQVPEDADVIFLGAITTSDYLSKKYQVAEHVWDVQKMSFFGMHGYIVTQKGYKPVVNKLMEFEDTCDTLMVDGMLEKSIKGYGIIPLCVHQSEGTSEIDFREKTLCNTKTLYSHDLNFENMGGYDRETKTNLKEIVSEYNYQKKVNVKTLF